MFTKAYKSILFFSPVLVCTISFGQIRPNNNAKDKTVVTDSIKLDTIIPVKEKLEHILDHKSEDEIHDRKKKMTYLLRKANVVYGDMTIEADYIELNWETGDVYAEGKRDSIGVITEQTKFTQGQQEVFQDAFKVNFKTKIGTGYNVRITEDEGVIVADKVKRLNDSVMLLHKADYTTDTYFKEGKTKDADYYLRANSGKMIDKNDKKVLITGPIQLIVYDVPTPLVLPFSYLPLGSNRSAGILMPRPGERSREGFFIEGIGFYYPIGEHLDIKLSTDIYTKGSWSVNAATAYRKRYRYSGNFEANIENRITGIKGLPSGPNQYNKRNSYGIRWSHTQDVKANPSLQFNANVNFTSSKYYQESIRNQYIADQSVFNNNINSSITLNKTFENSPFSASMSMSHSQNYQSGEINVTAPRLNVNMARIYPFAKKGTPKKGLLENIGMNYAFQTANEIRTNDTDFFTDKMWKDQSRLGASHRLTMATSITLANYFPISISSNYNEIWTDNVTRKSFNNVNKKVETATIKGFNAYRTFDISTSISTSIYGTFINKNKEAKIQGIRHIISPNIGFNFNPNFQDPSWNYYKSYEGANQEEIWYSQYQNALFGTSIPPLTNNMSFGFSNNLELKIKDEKDPKGYKKVKIFESLNINSGYNFSAEKFKLSPISISGMTSLFERKVNIQFGASINPYKIQRYINESGSEVSEYIDEIGNFQFTNMTIGTGYTFDNSTFGGKKFDAKNYTKQGTVRDENFYFDKDNYAHYAIPWSLTANLSYTYSKGTERIATHNGSINFSGKISPTPYWAISVNSTYDFVENDFTYVRFGFERDLRSFNLSFGWTPMGRYKSYDFFIGIKANLLSDLKYQDRSRFRY